MITEIAERIEVGAIFRRGRIRPVWFIWSSRKYVVKAVTYQWHEKKGSGAPLVRMYHFLVNP